MTLSRPQVRDLLEANCISPSKSLGQNFVVDPNTVRRIARLAGVGPGDRVLEIGGGLGSLTLALAETGAQVVVIETDRRLVPVLEETVSGQDDVDVIVADATEADWSTLMDPRQHWSVVANLPYNVATSIVLDIVEHAPQVDQLLVMLQREAGERLVAAPGTSAYGIPSVLTAYWATAELVGRVPASVFLPRPKVDSVLVRVTRRSRPAVEADLALLMDLVRKAFGQRRKMLRRSLAGKVDPASFATAGVRPEARPQELGIDDWGRLADAVAADG